MKTDHRTRTFLRNKEGKYLFMLRVRDNGDRAILLPGGGVEEGEMPHNANSREIQEELGISLRYRFKIGNLEGSSVNPALRPGDKDYSVERPYVFHFYFCDEWWDKEIEIKEKDKFESIHWIDLDKIQDLGLKLNARIGGGILEAVEIVKRFI